MSRARKKLRPSFEQLTALMGDLEDYGDNPGPFYAGILVSLRQLGVQGVKLAVAKSIAHGRPSTGGTAKESGYRFALQAGKQLLDLDGTTDHDEMKQMAWLVAREQAGNGSWSQLSCSVRAFSEVPPGIDPLHPQAQAEIDAIVKGHVANWQRLALDASTPTAKASTRRVRL